jgi:hypothetical protein
MRFARASCRCSLPGRSSSGSPFSIVTRLAIKNFVVGRNLARGSVFYEWKEVTVRKNAPDTRTCPVCGAEYPADGFCWDHWKETWAAARPFIEADAARLEASAAPARCIYCSGTGVIEPPGVRCGFCHPTPEEGQ